jgi:hypothetical protein
MVRSPIAEPTAGIDRTHRERADRPPRRMSGSSPRRDIAARRFRRRIPTTLCGVGVGFLTKVLRCESFDSRGVVGIEWSPGAPKVPLSSSPPPPYRSAISLEPSRGGSEVGGPIANLTAGIDGTRLGGSIRPPRRVSGPSRRRGIALRRFRRRIPTTFRCVGVGLFRKVLRIAWGIPYPFVGLSSPRGAARCRLNSLAVATGRRETFEARRERRYGFVSDSKSDDRGRWSASGRLEETPRRPLSLKGGRDTARRRFRRRSPTTFFSVGVGVGASGWQIEPRHHSRPSVGLDGPCGAARRRSNGLVVAVGPRELCESGQGRRRGFGSDHTTDGGGRWGASNGTPSTPTTRGGTGASWRYRRPTLSASGSQGFLRRRRPRTFCGVDCRRASSAALSLSFPSLFYFFISFIFPFPRAIFRRRGVRWPRRNTGRRRRVRRAAISLRYSARRRRGCSRRLPRGRQHRPGVSDVGWGV